MTKSEEKALSDIEEYGCHILHVMEESEGPGFSYSIGIEKTHKHPEIVVIGLKREISQWIINEYCGRISKGEAFEVDERYSGFLEGYDIIFEFVEKRHYENYFGWGLWLYGEDDFDVLQLIYPSVEGVWPWEQGATDYHKWSLPMLYAQRQT